MKRLLLIMAMLVLCGSVRAATVTGIYLDSLRNYRVQVLIYLNIDTTNTTYVTTGALDHLIREAIVTNMVLMRCDKTIDSTTVTKFRQNTYALDSLMLGVSSVEWSKNDSVKALMYVPRSHWYEMEDRSTVGQKNFAERPSYYDYDDDRVYLFPTPTVVGDTIMITGWQGIGTIDTISAFSSIPQKYRAPIARCAAWLVVKAKQHPLTETYKKDYMELLATINAALNSRGQGGTPDK